MNQVNINSEANVPDRRSLILDAATQLFCHNGYSGTRMSDIAEAINVTKPIVYRYFTSKEELFSAWVDVVLVQKRNAIVKSISNSDLSVREEALRILLRSVDGLNSPIILAPWRIALIESDNFPQITLLVREKFKTPIFQSIRELFKKGVENGEIRDADCETLARLFCAPIAAGASMLATFGQSYMDAKQMEDLFRLHHETFFNAWGC